MQYQNGKKLCAALLALALTAGALAGCSGSPAPESSSQASAVSSAAPESASSSDSSEMSSTASAPEGEPSAYSQGLTEDGYFEGVTALDLVTLPDYQTMKIPEDISTITDEALEDELQSRLSDYATTEQVTDRAVQDGDTVNIDYVGSVDGEEFAGGSTGGSGTNVVIGVTQYIDDFLEQLIGHKPGETFDVNVTFPDPYENNTDLSGKDAVFVTTINYVEEKTTPELTDEFVAANWKESEGWSTAEEAKNAIRAELRLISVGDYLWDEIQDKAEVSEVPDSVYQFQVNNMKNTYATMAAQYNMELEDFLTESLQVEDMDDLIEKNQSVLTTNAESALIMQALCEDMGLKVSDSDIASYFSVNMDIDDYSSYESQYGRPFLCLLAREDLAKRKLGERE